MRISDWSSDVCSSDLIDVDRRVGDRVQLDVAHQDVVAVLADLDVVEMRQLRRILEDPEESLPRDVNHQTWLLAAVDDGWDQSRPCSRPCCPLTGPVPGFGLAYHPPGHVSSSPHH